MKGFINKHHDIIVSGIQTFVTVLVIDGTAVLMNVYNGDFSEAALYAVGAVIVRSAVKAGMQQAFPGVFPARKSNGKKRIFNK